MFNDVHAHLWPIEHTPVEVKAYFEKRAINERIERTLSAEGLLEHMDRNAVERAIVTPLPPPVGTDEDGFKQVNAYVLAEARKSHGRLLPFCVADPLGGHASLAMVRRCIEEDGFRGLKLHPSFQQFFPNDPRLSPIYSFMQESRLPILFHTGTIGVAPARDKYSHANTLDEIACDFPQLIIVMGHAGRPSYDQTALLLRKHRNVYAEVSANFARMEGFKHLPMERLLHETKAVVGNVGKLLFGSDYPFYSQPETIAALEQARQSLNGNEPGFLTPEDMENIAHLNSRAFMS
jgi:uncharacterized protein